MSTKILALILCCSAALPLAAQNPPGVATPQTGSVALEWDPTPPPDDVLVRGYKLYVYEAGKRLAVHDTALATKFTVAALPLGKTYEFTVTAYDRWGIESLETEALAVPLGVPVQPPARLRVVEIQISSNLTEWKPLAFVPVADDDIPVFVRAVTTEINP